MAEKFEIRKARDGQYYFNLVGPNNEIIATSEMYMTKMSCESGINAVKLYAPSAPVEEIF